jgi:hypothetical protein
VSYDDPKLPRSVLRGEYVGDDKEPYFRDAGGVEPVDWWDSKGPKAPVSPGLRGLAMLEGRNRFAVAGYDIGKNDRIEFHLRTVAENETRFHWAARIGYSMYDLETDSRRYSEGFDDGHDIRPASNLLNSMTLAIARFVENPTGWQGAPDQDDKRIILDHIKSAVSKRLSRFCASQLREKARSDRQVAYGFRGSGSTFDHRMKIESLLTLGA